MSKEQELTRAEAMAVMAQLLMDIEQAKAKAMSVYRALAGAGEMR